MVVMGRALAAVAFGLCCAFIAPGAAAQENRSTLLEGLARTSLVQHIRPGYTAFQDRVDHLGGAVEQLCDTFSQENYSITLDAYREAVLTWAQVEHLRFGPVVEKNRYERVAFWPDSKGLGRRQVQRALRRRDMSVTDVATLREKSVALQGLTALEIVLHGKPIVANTATGAPDQEAEFRCRFASAIVSNLIEISQAIIAEWSDGARFAEIWLSAGAPDNPVYLDVSEVALELVRAYEFGLQTVRDLKLMRPLGLTRPRRQATLPPYFISGLSVPVLGANVAGIRHLFVHGGLMQFVSISSQSLADGVVGEMDQVVRLAEAVETTGREAFRTPDDRNRLITMGFPLKNALNTGATEIKRAAGLSIGFNASDGD